MAELALSEHYPKIIEQEKIDAISRPEIAITKLARKNPLGFKIKTAVLPEIKLPGSILTGLTIRRYDGFKSAPSYANLKPEEVSQPLKDYGVHILFKQALDGSIIIGDSHEYADAGNEESLDFFNDNHINDLMLNEAKRILNLPSWAIRYQWNGFYAQHKTEEVFTHTVGKNIHICCGIGGKGMTTSAGFTEQHIAGIYSR
jgi:hypothetical protein